MARSQRSSDKTNNSLSKRRRIKNKSNALQCVGCKQIFPSRDKLTKHMKFSSKKACSVPEKIHICEICGKEFTSNKTLQHHIRKSKLCQAISNPDYLGSMDIPSLSPISVKTNYIYNKNVNNHEGVAVCNNGNVSVYQDILRDPFLQIQKSSLCLPVQSSKNSVPVTSGNHTNCDDKSATNITSNIELMEDHVKSQLHNDHKVAMDVTQFISCCEESYVMLSLQTPLIKNGSDISPSDNIIIQALALQETFGPQAQLFNLKSMKMKIRNSVSMCMLDNDFPPVSNSTLDLDSISDADIDGFLFRHADIHINNVVYHQSKRSDRTHGANGIEDEDLWRNKQPLFVDLTQLIADQPEVMDSHNQQANMSTPQVVGNLRTELSDEEGNIFNDNDVILEPFRIIL